MAHPSDIIISLRKQAFIISDESCFVLIDNQASLITTSPSGATTVLLTVRMAVACCSASDYGAATRSKLTNSFAFTSKCTCGSIKTVFIDFCYGLISLKLMGATDN